MGEIISNIRELEALQNEARKTEITNKFIVINSTDGDFHVHRMGCADIKRREIQKQGINSMWWSEATDVDTLVKDEIKDLEEGGFEKGDFDENNFNVYPCARGVGSSEKNTILMRGASKEARAADIEQSDREFIAKQQQRKKKKKSKSKTSGWSKLKEELPTSGAVKTRLSDGGHSDGYRKVLESLEKYWTKRGK